MSHSAVATPQITRPIRPDGGFRIVINNGDVTTQNIGATVTLFAGKDVTHMMISNTPDFAGATAVPFSQNAPWRLSDGAGVKTVYVKFFDSQKNGSPVVSDAIIVEENDFARSESSPAPLAQTQALPMQSQPRGQVLGVKVSRTQTMMSKPSALAARLSGSILLQTEGKGEAWYVNPDNKKRYYLGRPADAFAVMRALGLGVKHTLLTRTEPYYGRLLGKILLDVESRGEAYYISPKDKQRHSLGRPADAFRTMRSFGLGVTNKNLETIEIAAAK